MKSPSPETLDITEEDLHAWCQRMRDVLAGSAGDFVILQALVTAYLAVRRTLSAAKISMARLRRLFGVQRTEKTKDVFPDAGDEGQGTTRESGVVGGSDDGATEGSGDDPKKKKRRKPVKGHGRNGVAAYTAGVRIPVPLEGAYPGCPCPECKKGKLGREEPGKFLRVFGQPMLMAKIWEPERWRCSLCKQIFYAQVPAEARGPTYDATAVAMIAILHCGNGFPFHRLGQLQASLGIPIPASDQSEVLRDAYRSLLPVLEALIRCAAQCDVVHNDDTGMKILSLLAQIRESSPSQKGKSRTGIFTTGIVAITGIYRIALFFTGRKHAGENLAAVFEHRDPALPPPTHMSDGLDRNDPGNVQTDEGKCLTHSRRLFVDIVSCFPDECRRVVEDLRQVYRVDAIAKERNLSQEDRLLLHKEKSAPVMDGLRRWLTEQLVEGVVEPNSVLGKAIVYMIRLWTPLTLFLRKAGAPLDNNIVERILKKAIRHRKNSLFYKTERGAAVGDFFMSLIETCALNKVDAFHYLTSLVRNVHRVKDSPESWMPWNYRTMVVPSRSAATDDQKPQVVRQEPKDAGRTQPDSAPNPQGTDQGASVNDQGHLLGTQGSIATPSAGCGDDSPPPRATGSITAAGPVVPTAPPGPCQPVSRDETTSPGPPWPGSTRCEPPKESRSPT